MLLPRVMFGQGFSSFRPIMEKKYERQTQTIGGKKITQKKGKLSDDLGKPATRATETELQSYIDAGKGKEKQKRVARVNLMKAHKKGHKSQGHKLAKPKKG